MFFENRRIIRFFLKNKFLKKQNKLTTYLVNILKLDTKSILNFFEFRLNIILIRCHYFDNLRDSNFFIKKGFISINNEITFDTECLVKHQDLIKLINKKQYYIYYRRNINNALYSSKKINWAFHRFKKKNRFRKVFTKVYKWIYNGIYFGFDIPYFLEVDYVNLTIIVLKKPLNLYLIQYSSVKFLNLYLTRLYNWNYIN